MTTWIARTVSICLALIATSQEVFAQEQRQVVQPVTGEFLMKFTVIDPTRALINEQAILSKVAQELKARTKMRPSVERRGAGPIERGLAKVEWARDEPFLYVIYQALQTGSSGGKYGQTLGIRTAFKIERTPSDITIALQPEANARFMEQKLTLFGFGGVKTPTIDIEAVLDDFRHLMDETKNLELTMTAEVNGEVESKYPVDALLGNFERRYPIFSAERAPSSAAGVKKERVVTMTLANQHVPLRVTGYPYRDGAKISYSVKVPYSIRADGSTKGFELIDKVRAEITAVVNE